MYFFWFSDPPPKKKPNPCVNGVILTQWWQNSVQRAHAGRGAKTLINNEILHRGRWSRHQHLR